jgi:hypothetical protein
MRCSKELKTRLWALLVLHVRLSKGWFRQTKDLPRPPKGRTKSSRSLPRLAVIWDAKKGAERPLRHVDAVNILNRLDEERGLKGRVSRGAVTDAIHDLYKDGVVRTVGPAVKNGQLLFVYAKPLKSARIGAGEPGPEPPSDDENCSSGDNNPESSGSKQNHLHKQIVTLKQSSVKALYHHTREAFADLPAPVAAAATHKVEAAAGELKALLDRLEKELAEIIEPPEEEERPAAPPVLLAGLRELFQDEVIGDEALMKLDGRIVAAIGDYPREALVTFVTDKKRRRKFGFGLVLKDRGLADEFIAISRKQQSARVAIHQQHRQKATHAAAMAGGSTFAEYCANYGIEVPADEALWDELNERWLNGEPPS